MNFTGWYLRWHFLASSQFLRLFCALVLWFSIQNEKRKHIANQIELYTKYKQITTSSSKSVLKIDFSFDGWMHLLIMLYIIFHSSISKKKTSKQNNVYLFPVFNSPLSCSIFTSYSNI